MICLLPPRRMTVAERTLAPPRRATASVDVELVAFGVLHPHCVPIEPVLAYGCGEHSPRSVSRLTSASTRCVRVAVAAAGPICSGVGLHRDRCSMSPRGGRA